MLWALPLGMAALGAIQGQRKQDRLQKMNQAEAETTRYSPWTGMKGQLHDTGGGWFDGALQGGVTGAMMGQGMGGEEAAAGGQMEKMGAANTAAYDSGQYDKLKGLRSVGNPYDFSGMMRG